MKITNFLKLRIAALLCLSLIATGIPSMAFAAVPTSSAQEFVPSKHPSMGSGSVSTPSVSTPSVATPSVSTPSVATPSGSSGGSSSSGSSSSKRVGSSSSSGAWQQDSTGWWFRYSDGTWPSSKWEKLTWNNVSDWYYFNADGYMVTGWFTDASNKYYLHTVSDGTMGHMYIGWHQIDGVWYYFNTVSDGTQGRLFVSTTTPDGYNVDANGAWVR